MPGLLRWTVFVAVVVAGLGWVLTRPGALPVEALAGLSGDPVAGALVFHAGGCASCHAAPGAGADAAPVLSGGRRFESQFGTFLAPNISPDPVAGIGGWTPEQFARALWQGVSPAGRHYYPAFPYTAYIHMQAQDVVDLFAYMRSLPPSQTASLPHDLAFPFSIRRAVGFWKLLYLNEEFVVSGDLTAPQARGRYLAEGLAHCGECHTSRGPLGGLDRDRWLAGAPNPSGKGQIPAITPDRLDWSEADLIAYFTTGLTPDYDSAGGQMAEVIENLARLPEADRAAIAAYLAVVPASR